MYERNGNDSYGYGSGTTFPGAYSESHPAAAAGEPAPQVWYRSPSGDAPSGQVAASPVDVTAGPHSYDPIADPAGAGFTPVEPEPLYPMRNGAGRGALILGIGALICTTVLFVLFPLGIVLAITAIVLGRRGRFRARYGFASNGGSASAGVALGVAALLLGVCLTALTAWLASTYDVVAARDCVVDSSTGPQVIRCLADVVEAR